MPLPDDRRHERPMSQVTQVQFYDAMQNLRDHIDEKHASTSVRLAANHAEIRHELATHSREDLIVANRVLVIETERRQEARQAIKHSSTVAFLVSAGLTALWQGLARWWK